MLLRKHKISADAVIIYRGVCIHKRNLINFEEKVIQIFGIFGFCEICQKLKMPKLSCKFHFFIIFIVAFLERLFTTDNSSEKQSVTTSTD